MDLEDFDNGTAYAHYGSFGVGLFSVDPEEDGYPLTVADYSGTAGEAPVQQGELACQVKAFCFLGSGSRSQVRGALTPATLWSLGRLPISQREELSPELEPGDPQGLVSGGRGGPLSCR